MADRKANILTRFLLKITREGDFGGGGHFEIKKIICQHQIIGLNDPSTVNMTRKLQKTVIVHIKLPVSVVYEQMRLHEWAEKKKRLLKN